MTNVNQVQMGGNLTRDPELQYTPNSTAIAKFGVAVNRSYKKGNDWVDDVSYVEVQCWGKLAERVANGLFKGNGVVIFGRIQQDRWEKDGRNYSKVYVVADKIVKEARDDG